MPTVRPASSHFNPSHVLCPPEREDEPDFCECVVDALIVAGFLPIVGFRATADGPFVRVTFSEGSALRERVLLAWAALAPFDSALLDATTILVGWPGELQAVAA